MNMFFVKVKNFIIKICFIWVENKLLWEYFKNFLLFVFSFVWSIVRYIWIGNMIIR